MGFGDQTHKRTFMAIWFNTYSLDDWKGMDQDTIHESLGIELTELGPDFLKGRMPVDHRTVQPARILHGGASVVLAESLGSIGSFLIVDPEKHLTVGQSVTANHIRPGTEGFVTGIARPIHIGKRSHIWSIDIVNEEEKLVCTVRLTMAIVPKP